MTMLKKLGYICVLGCQVLSCIAGDFEMHDQRSSNSNRYHDQSDGIYNEYKFAIDAADYHQALTLAKELLYGDKQRAVTPLMYAVDKGSPELVQEMLDMGFQINDRSITGKTCLHALAISSNPHAVRIAGILREQPGIDFSIKDKTGQTSYDLAIAYANQHIAPFLNTQVGEENQLSPRDRLRQGSANWRSRLSRDFEEQPTAGSSWSVLKYFLGGMGLAATLYYAYDKFFRDRARV